MRRAKSNVTVASVAVGERTEVTCSRDVKLVADTTLAQVKHQQVLELVDWIKGLKLNIPTFWLV